ncbi:arginyltransferase [Shewanella intestini]|uniref:Aspartate/glutamate leucyltransferase n=1 Tax=Shewanella intestini TaxID=2017544 RepID=A0ABS5I1C4_9GAMM|nr:MULTISPECIES: arginyltransferase [Shewanella]MBR9727831.1 arginyltransferase [Shewanella intestini]
MSSNTLNVAVTKTFECSYIPGNQERLLVIQENQLNDHLFEQLLAMGFRRNGNAIYKPHCGACQQCVSIRVPALDFIPSKRQKRTLKANQHIHWQVSHQASEHHFPLYCRYINQRHNDGPMFPPTSQQYNEFLDCDWLEPTFIELFDGEKLIGVAVTDMLPNSLSAIYSYFDPDYEKNSLGSLMILLQCELAKEMGKQFVYLGYQIDDNIKMRYKRQYRPYQLLTASGWQIHQQLS